MAGAGRLSTAFLTQQSASRATVAIRVMAGAGRPSTTFFVASSVVVVGGPAPAITPPGSVALLPHFPVKLRELCGLSFLCALCVKILSCFAANHSDFP